MKQEFDLIDARLKPKWETSGWTRTVVRADWKPRPDSSASGVSVWCGSGQGTGSRYHLTWRTKGLFRVRMSSTRSHVIQVTAANCPVEIDSSGLRRWRRRRWVSIKSCDRYPRGDNSYVKGISAIAGSRARHRSQECGGYLSPEHIITVVMTDRVYRGEPHQSSPTHTCTHTWRTLPDSAGT